MEFTYKSYVNLLTLLKTHGYEHANYHNWKEKSRCVILRHDIDNDIEKALELARIEKQEGVQSTFFTLVTSDFYNIYSSRNAKLLRDIMECGHEVGLHFDEVRYPEIASPEGTRERILEEAEFLGRVIGQKVTTVSMHRPSKMILEADLHIPGMINSYGQVFFKGFKYVSDSRKRWREPVEKIVMKEEYERLHILTHAIWYDDVEKSIKDSLISFIGKGNEARYDAERENITDLESIIKKEFFKNG